MEVTQRDYAKRALTEEEVRGIVAVTGVAPVLNTRHEVAKREGWKEAPPDVDTFVRAVLAEPNLLRRPILVRDGRYVVGKDEAAIRELLTS